MVEAALGAGLPVLEITLDSHDAMRQISLLRESFPAMTLGAGTVIEGNQSLEAIAAGADFVVTPTLVPEVVEGCVARGVPCIAGAATPTEVLAAHRLGATAVKVFPVAQLGGPAYLKALRAPLGGIPLVPTGGIGTEDVTGYLQAGALAVGVGSSIFSRDALERGDPELTVGLAVANLLERLS